MEAAKAVDFPIQTFRGSKNFLAQALSAWERHAEIEEARHETDAQTDEQLCREVARTRLGSEVLVKLKMDELLEREYLPADVSASQVDPDAAAVKPRIGGVIHDARTESISSALFDY